MKNLGVSGVSFAGLRDESPHDQSAPFFEKTLKIAALTNSANSRHPAKCVLH
jgi:hypothetical protein